MALSDLGPTFTQKTEVVARKRLPSRRTIFLASSLLALPVLSGAAGWFVGHWQEAIDDAKGYDHGIALEGCLRFFTEHPAVSPIQRSDIPETVQEQCGITDQDQSDVPAEKRKLLVSSADRTSVRVASIPDTINAIVETYRITSYNSEWPEATGMAVGAGIAVSGELAAVFALAQQARAART